MKKLIVQSTCTRDPQRGAVAVIAAVCLTVLVSMAALAIDVGKIATVKNELQNIADAAALAGAESLYSVYDTDKDSAGQCDNDCMLQVRNAAKTVVGKNLVDGNLVEIDDDDIRIGYWHPGTNIFSEDGTQHNAVRATARKDQVTNNSITLFFAGIFGKSNIDLRSNHAIASLPFLSNTEPLPQISEESELTTPFAVSQIMFPDNCTDVVQFRPSASCAGWHNFTHDVSSSDIGSHALGIIYRHQYAGERDLFSGREWIENNFNINIVNFERELRRLYDTSNLSSVNHVYSVGDRFNFIGGVSSTQFSNHRVDPETYDGNTSDNTLNSSGNVASNPNNPAPIFALFDYFRYRDEDDDDDVWTTTVAVYEEEGVYDIDCNNPNTDIRIVGFAKATVILPRGPFYSEIDIDIDCQFHTYDGDGNGDNEGNNVGEGETGNIIGHPRLVK